LALSVTLTHYLKDEALQQIPIWRMIAASPDSLRTRVQAWVDALGAGFITASQSTIGGGSLPDENLPTFCLALSVQNPNRFLDRLRELHPPVIARLENNLVLFDPRTILTEQEPIFIANLQFLLNTNKTHNKVPIP
jgi:L-seryl-tRNA(Ser) seleniumtransferase